MSNSNQFRLRSLVAALGFALLVPLSTPAQRSAAASATVQPMVSIRELMEMTITPATNTIWSFYEPPSEDAQWLELEQAAVTLVAAATLTAAGGNGASDAEWAADPRWQAFNKVMLDAGMAALQAVRARDHAALLEAGDILYPPCEGCHAQFHPELNATQ